VIGHRTQPYRTGQARMPGLALEAMLRGRAPGQTFNGADFLRQQRHMAKGGDVRAHIRQRMQPRATADVRGMFDRAMAPQISLQDILRALSGGGPAIAPQIRRQPITFEPRV
jgi:hypothetical protein